MDSTTRSLRRLIRRTERTLNRLDNDINRLALERINIEMSLQETEQIQQLLLATDGLLEEDRQRIQLFNQIDELEEQRDEYMACNHLNLLHTIDNVTDSYTRESKKLDILKECYAKLKRIRSR
jgi:hypothetical protein